MAILDSDDHLRPDWGAALTRVIEEWPRSAQVCWTACVNRAGAPTVADPEFRGMMGFAELARETHPGEYMPIFRGNYIRGRPYLDLGTRKSCGILSYLEYAKDGAFWVTPEILRVYDDARLGSTTSGWWTPSKARETVKCYEAVIQRHGAEIKVVSRRAHARLLLRLAVYRRLARDRGAWRTWAAASHRAAPAEAAAAFIALLLGPRFTAAAARSAKRIGVMKRHG